MIPQTYQGCVSKQNRRVSFDFLTNIVQCCCRIIRLTINILYIYRFLTAINGLRLRGQNRADDDNKVRAPYMCATRHHLSVEPDVIELHKELRKIMYRFKLEVRYMAHTIQHNPNFIFQTIPLFDSNLRLLQCSLDDLELATTFDTYTSRTPTIPCSKNNNTTSISAHKSENVTRPNLMIVDSDETSSSTIIQQTTPVHEPKLESDEEQVYLISRNIHLALHTLLINAKLIHSTTKRGVKAGLSTLLFPFIYDIGKKFCLSFYYLQLISKYISFRAIQTENRPVPPLTDYRVNIYPANRNMINQANQVLVDHFARTMKRPHVRFNVATQQALPQSILTRRFSLIKKSSR